MFNSQSMREEFYQSRMQLKGIKLKDINSNYEENNDIFMNHGQSKCCLFRKVRQLCKVSNFKFFGHLMAKLCVGKQRIHLPL